MELSRDLVKYVAKLSALALTDEEIEKFRIELGNTLELVAKLQSVDTDSVIPTSHIHGLFDTFRDDIAGNSSIDLDSIANMTTHFSRGTGYKVPIIIEEE